MTGTPPESDLRSRAALYPRLDVDSATITDLLDRLAAVEARLAATTQALCTLIEYAREVDIDAALIMGGVDVRAALAGLDPEKTPA